MSQHLVVVESPAKAKTIKKYLSKRKGESYQVKASVGHIIDLPKSKLGVDVEHEFKPAYEVIPGKKKVLQELRKAAKEADSVYLAPDPDREGEAIAWHIAESIRGDNTKVYRVTFNEITERAVNQAISNPGQLDRAKFESQQARRILDRLVGYQISPLLWQKVGRGLSAGRVQSVAVKLVVDRELERRAFKPAEYWTLDARLAAATPPPFTARLAKISGKKAVLNNEAETRAVVKAVEGGPFTVAAVQRKERKRSAPAPYTTSKLQQEASARLKFTAKRTMALAQMLYEGVDTGGKEGVTGLITYMRTDSTRLSPDAVAAVRGYIKETYGPEFIPESPNFFKSRKSAQDAHEAIRPTNLAFTPAVLKDKLDRDAWRLYTMIWDRFLACQMTPAVFDQTTVTVTSGIYEFSATGSVMKFPGWLKAYGQGEEAPPVEEPAVPAANGTAPEEPEPEQAALPNVSAGDKLTLQKLVPEQHFTQPPPRFTEGTLVKELEEDGIGRPSTYAAILSTIQDKKYVRKVDGKFAPTELGEIVTDLLVKSFPSIIDTKFTADMEARLDEVEEGGLDWRKLLKDFHGPFTGSLATAKAAMRNLKAESRPTDIKCDKCGGMMVVKWGRGGSFLGCGSYPTCKNIREYAVDDNGVMTMIIDPIAPGLKCPLCASAMAMKKSRFGDEYYRCVNYPDCKGTRPKVLGVPCPKCGSDVAARRSRFGRLFYGCTQYGPGKPTHCDFVSWDPPYPQACTKCGGNYLVVKETKRDGKHLRCPACKAKYDLPASEPASSVTSASAVAGAAAIAAAE